MDVGKLDDVSSQGKDYRAGRLFDGVGLGSSVAVGNGQWLSLRWGEDHMGVAVMKWIAVVKFDRRYGNVPLRWLAEHMPFGFDWKVKRR